MIKHERVNISEENLCHLIAIPILAMGMFSIEKCNLLLYCKEIGFQNYFRALFSRNLYY